MRKSPEKLGGNVWLCPGDCVAVLDQLKSNSIDSCVCDPPYHLQSIHKRFAKVGRTDKTHTRSDPHQRHARGFMNQQWDGGDVAFRKETWQKVYRVLKPGAHLIAFCGTRNYHRLACAIEDAGFEIRDMLSWLYGSGFPKSHSVQKAIEGQYECRFLPNVKTAELQSKHSLVELREGTTGSVLGFVVIPREAERAKLTVIGAGEGSFDQTGMCPLESTDGTFLNIETLWSATSADRSNPTRRFITTTKLSTITESKILSLLPKLNMLGNICGAGSALKPACEPICLARKPLSEKTVAANVLKWGTGAINVDGCRIGTDGGTSRSGQVDYPKNADGTEDRSGSWARTGHAIVELNSGRWPANVAHDGSVEVLSAFPDAPGALYATGPEYGAKKTVNVYGDYGPRKKTQPRGRRNGGFVDTGADKGDRRPNGPTYDENGGSAARFFFTAKADADDRVGFNHPTVKPLDLMQWLVRMVTPKGGVCLDPFAGTGTTGEACWRERCKAILIEAEVAYQKMIRKRVKVMLDGRYAREVAKMAREKPKPGALFDV